MTKNKRIETKTSRTAEMTCLTRAVSYYEKDPNLKCDDLIAPRLVPSYILPLIKLKIGRNIYKSRLVPKGMFAYVVARTKFIDSVFKAAAKSGFDQIIILGAGFDSRTFRLLEGNERIKVYELDAPITQNAKIGQLKKRGIIVPSNLVFVPIDLTKQSIEDRLKGSGFRENMTTLFVMEGLLMYLDHRTVDSTFKVIDSLSGPGSEVVFDVLHPSVLRKEGRYYGEKDAYDTVSKAGERWTFGMEREHVRDFLNSYHLSIVELMDSDLLEKRFIIGRVNGTHFIVHARK